MGAWIAVTPFLLPSYISGKSGKKKKKKSEKAADGWSVTLCLHEIAWLTAADLEKNK